MSQENIIQTSSIHSTLSIYAKNNNYKEEDLDFNLIKIQTTMSHKSSMIMIDLEKLDKYKEQKMPIKQSYDIEVLTTKNKFSDMKSSIITTDSKSKAIMIISKDSKVQYYDEIEKDLKEHIRKEKAIHKILIDTQEGNLDKDINSFLEKIKKKEPLKQDISIQIYDSTSFISSKKACIKYPYIPDIKYSEVNRNYLFTKKDGVIVEIFKGHSGKNGFDCMGELQKSKPVGKIDSSKIKNGKNVRIEESEDKEHIYLISNIDGMVSCTKWLFNVGTKFNFTDLKFKKFHSFKAPLDNKDISIDIQEGTNGDDAVGSSIRITAGTINITGNIGPTVKLIGNDIKIIGSTHKTSTVIAKKCFIKSAKGYIQAEDMEITYLEQGELHGGKVKVMHLQGGKTMGKNITIENLHSHNSIISSNSIAIDNIQGGSNDLMICANGYYKFAKNIEQLNQNIQTFTKQYTKAKIQKVKTQYNLHIEKIKELKSLALKLKSNKKNFANELKELNIVIASMEKLKEILLLNKKNMEYLLQLKKYDSLLEKGIVTAQSNWQKGNIVIFKKVASTEQISASPDGDIKKLTLHKVDDKEIILMDI